MAGITFKVEGLEKLIANINAFDNNTRSAIDISLKDAVLRWKRGAVRDAPADVGGLRQSIQEEKMGDLDYEVHTYKKYSWAVEFGTKSKFSAPAELQSIAAGFRGTPTGSFKQLLANILGWVHRKAIINSSGRFVSKGRPFKRHTRNELSVAYPIALHIARFGVKPQPYFYKQREIVEPILKKDIENIVNNVKL